MKLFWVDASKENDGENIDFTIFFRREEKKGNVARWYLEVQTEEEEVIEWFELDVPDDISKVGLITKAFSYIDEHFKLDNS